MDEGRRFGSEVGFVDGLIIYYILSFPVIDLNLFVNGFVGTVVGFFEGVNKFFVGKKVGRLVGDLVGLVVVN